MNWENYKYFIYLSRHQKLSGASKALGVSHTTVYRRIKAFEEELGIQLFELVSNRYRLTPVGSQLLEKLIDIEQNLVQVSRELEGLDARISGRIVIASTDTIGFTLLPRLIQGLHDTFPELKVEVNASGEILSMSKREADIAIRATNEPPEGLIGRRVGKMGFALYASQSYLKQNPFKESRGFEGHTLIQFAQRARAVSARKWLEQLPIGEDVIRLKAHSMLNIAQFCNEGLGLALLPKYLNRHFKNLKLVMEPKELPTNELWILYHRDLMKTARVRVAADYLYKRLKPIFIT